MNTRLVAAVWKCPWLTDRDSGTAAYFCMQLEQFSSNYVVQCQMLLQMDWQRHSNAATYVIPVLSTSCTATSLWHWRRLLTSRVFVVRASSKRLVSIGFSWHPWIWCWERVVGNVVTWFRQLLGRTAVRPTQQFRAQDRHIAGIPMWAAVCKHFVIAYWSACMSVFV